LITDDIELLKEIFTIIDDGISETYEKFVFNIDIFENYSVETLTLTLNGREVSNVESEHDSLKLLGLIKELHAISKRRGEDWKVLTLSYIPGEQVITKYSYEHLEENKI